MKGIKPTVIGVAKKGKGAMTPVLSNKGGKNLGVTGKISGTKAKK